jgi:hypothetical protein
MSDGYFKCPHCGNNFDDEAMLYQEYDMFEPIDDEDLPVFCHCCSESFVVKRRVKYTFIVLEQAESHE